MTKFSRVLAEMTFQISKVGRLASGWAMHWQPLLHFNLMWWNWCPQIWGEGARIFPPAPLSHQIPNSCSPGLELSSGQKQHRGTLNSGFHFPANFNVVKFFTIISDLLKKFSKNVFYPVFIIVFSRRLFQTTYPHLFLEREVYSILFL